MTPDEHPSWLIFDGGRTSGEYLVRDPDATPVIAISKRWSGSGFTTTAMDGAVLSTTERRGFLATRWTTVDPDGYILVTSRVSGRGAAITFADERSARIRGRAFGADWTMVDGSGRVLATGAPYGSPWKFGARPWRVQVHDPVLTTVEVVAIVEAHRLDREHSGDCAVVVS